MKERKVAERRRAEHGERNREGRRETGVGMEGLTGAYTCEPGRSCVAQEEIVDIVLERRRETWRTLARTVGVGGSSTGRVRGEGG